MAVGFHTGGKPKHVPTEKTMAEVSALAGFGVVQEEIAKYLGIDAKTLRKHYRKELDLGVVRANAAVARSLFKQATEDGSVSAAIFWLKARAGWRETQQVDHVSSDGSMSPQPVIDASALSPETLKDLMNARRAARSQS